MPFIAKREATATADDDIFIDLPPNGYLYSASLSVWTSENLERETSMQILFCNIVADDVIRCMNLQSVELTDLIYGRVAKWSGKIPFGLHMQVRARVKSSTVGDFMVLKVLWDND